MSFGLVQTAARPWKGRGRGGFAKNPQEQRKMLSLQEGQAGRGCRVTKPEGREHGQLWPDILYSSPPLSWDS